MGRHARGQGEIRFLLSAAVYARARAIAGEVAAVLEAGAVLEGETETVRAMRGQGTKQKWCLGPYVFRDFLTGECGNLEER